MTKKRIGFTKENISLPPVALKAEYPNIDNYYKNYLLESYEDTYYPNKIIRAGKATYVERNCEMINNSRFCIVYYDAPHAPTNRKSGTKIALDYAIKKQKHIIVLPTEITNM